MTCQKYLVNYSWSTGEGTGEPLKWESGPNEWSPVERKANQPTPCGSCPKKGPQYEREFLLSEKNARALAFYRQTKATFGRGLSEEEAQDGTVRRNFSILEGLFAGAEREGLTNAISLAVGRWFPMSGG